MTTKKKFRPWRKKLSKADLRHLKDVGVDSKKSFSRMNDWHNGHRKKVGGVEPCFYCKSIAFKLGLDVYSRAGRLISVGV